MYLPKISLWPHYWLWYLVRKKLTSSSPGGGLRTGLLPVGDWRPIPCEWTDAEELVEDTDESNDVVGDGCYGYVIKSTLNWKETCFYAKHITVV